MLDYPFGRPTIDPCEPKNEPGPEPQLLICQDYEDIYMMAFEVGPQLASQDFILKDALLVQNSASTRCKNQGNLES